MNPDEYRIFAQSHPFLSSAAAQPLEVAAQELLATAREESAREESVQEKINRKERNVWEKLQKK